MLLDEGLMRMHISLPASFQSLEGGMATSLSLHTLVGIDCCREEHARVVLEVCAPKVNS